MKFIILLCAYFATCYGQVEFSARSRNFSIELLHYTQLQTDGHVVISPFGIWTLMTGVALGATGNSYSQLSRAFILPRNINTLISGYQDLTRTVLESSTTGVSLTSKNFVFLANDFSIYEGFRNAITSDFGASLKLLDFHDPDAAAKTANSYIQNSGAKVTNVLSSQDFAESKMILSNVITFKGVWKFPFNTSETTIESFYNEDKEIIGEVKMMYQRASLPFSNIQALKAFAVELPYGTDDKYSMLVLLPYPRTKLTDMYQRLAVMTLPNIFKKLQDDIEEFGVEDIDVRIPRIRISTNVVLNKPLNDMGVYDIFQPDLASFSRVSKENIFVSAIIHKAEIEVTETGTVASASTTAQFADRKSTPAFVANKPFVYFVVEKSTTTVIFGGIYSKPSVY